MRPIALALALSGCSALGLGEHGPPPCQIDDDCAVLNDHFGLDPSGCDLYQCNIDNACERRRRDDDDDGQATRLCGGSDCDDTGVPSDGAVIVFNVPNPAWLHFAGGPGSIAVAYELADGAGFDALMPGVDAHDPTAAGFARDEMPNELEPENTLTNGCYMPGAIPQEPPSGTPVGVIVGTTCETHLECQDGDVCNGWETCEPTSFDPDLDARKCRPARIKLCPSPEQVCDAANVRCLEPIPSSCAFGELAIAHAIDDEWFAIGLDVLVCPEGRVIAGWISTGPDDLSVGSPGARLVVHGDRQRAPGFMGIDLDGSECTGGSRGAGPRGASSLAIASLPRAPTFGRFRPQALAAWLACATPGCAGNVEILGLVHEHDPATTGRATTWVTPSEAAQPLALDTPSAGGAIGIAAIESTSGSGYTIAYGASDAVVVRFVPQLAEPAGVDHTGDSPTILDDTPRSTPPIPPLGAEVRIDAPSAVSDVTIAAGGEGVDGVVPVRIAWVEGGTLYAAAAIVHPSDGTITVETEARFATGAASPSIVHTDAGYALTWIESSGAWLAQIAEDGASGTVRLVSAGATRARAFDDGALRVAFYDPNREALISSSAICSP